MAVRPIDANELLGIERLLDTDVVRQSKTASWLLNQVLHDIQAMPTLTPPDEPLTCEGCIHEEKEHQNCNYCMRASYLGDYYYRCPPEGGDADHA